jgi:hypothetical protein
VVDCVGQWVQHRFWPVKRRRALLESNPPRNSRPETHRGRWEGRGVKAGPFILARGRPTGGGIRLPARRVLPHIGPIDLVMPQKTHNQGPRFPRLFGAPAAPAWWARSVRPPEPGVPARGRTHCHQPVAPWPLLALPFWPLRALPPTK